MPFELLTDQVEVVLFLPELLLELADHLEILLATGSLFVAGFYLVHLGCVEFGLFFVFLLED